MSWTLDSDSDKTCSPSAHRGKIESMKVLNRDDNSLTLLFQRRHFVVDRHKMEGRSKRQRKTVEDPETQRVIDDVRFLNKKIREMRIGKNKEKGDKKKDKEDPETETETEDETKTTSESSSASTAKSSRRRKGSKERQKKDEEAYKKYHYSMTSDDEVQSAKQKVHKEPCDHLGVPLSHPLAVTPFPNASTVAERVKARLMLKEYAIRARQEQEAKERAVAMEKELEKYKKKSSEKSSSSSSVESAGGSESKKSGDSVALKSSKSSKLCETCGSCKKCAQKCHEKHKVTDQEREKFFKGIKKLRKRLVNPESSREHATKSPYDVTQSLSDASVLGKDSTKKAKKTKKNKKVKAENSEN